MYPLGGWFNYCFVGSSLFDGVGQFEFSIVTVDSFLAKSDAILCSSYSYLY